MPLFQTSRDLLYQTPNRRILWTMNQLIEPYLDFKPDARLLHQTLKRRMVWANCQQCPDSNQSVLKTEIRHFVVIGNNKTRGYSTAYKFQHCLHISIQGSCRTKIILYKLCAIHSALMLNLGDHLREYWLIDLTFRLLCQLNDITVTNIFQRCI